VIPGLCIMIAGVAMLGCGDAMTYTLYRNSPISRTRDCTLQRSIQAMARNTTARTAKQRATCFSSSRASRRSFDARKEYFAGDLPAAASMPPAVKREAEEDWPKENWR
jgi:hypothetical protein